MKIKLDTKVRVKLTNHAVVLLQKTMQEARLPFRLDQVCDHSDTEYGRILQTSLWDLMRWVGDVEAEGCQKLFENMELEVVEENCGAEPKPPESTPPEQSSSAHDFGEWEARSRSFGWCVSRKVGIGFQYLFPDGSVTCDVSHSHTFASLDEVDKAYAAWKIKNSADATMVPVSNSEEGIPEWKIVFKPDPGCWMIQRRVKGWLQWLDKNLIVNGVSSGDLRYATKEEAELVLEKLKKYAKR